MIFKEHRFTRVSLRVHEAQNAAMSNHDATFAADADPDRAPSISDIIDSSEALLAITSLKRNCARCGLTFTEANNLGRWRCTAYHPLFELTMPGDRRYRCCNRVVGEPGCVAADHNDVLDEPRERTVVAPHTAALFVECGIAPQHTAVDARTGVLEIRRFDEAQQRALTHPTLVVSQKRARELQDKLAKRRCIVNDL